MNKAGKFLALTPGCENGIGPMLMLKAINEIAFNKSNTFYWCGDRYSLEHAAKLAQVDLSLESSAIHTTLNHQKIKFFNRGFDEKCPLKRQALALRKSVELAKNHQIDAIVTGPIEKSALAMIDGEKYAGQTEYFAKHLRKPGCQPCMAFLGGPFILSLLTTHMPLSEVATTITTKRLLTHLRTKARECAKVLGKDEDEVSIKVFGLNPHAGEDGLLGFEEKEFITPAIRAAKSLGLNVQGPLPADGFFSYFHLLKPQEIPDAVVAIYHDQGLAPFKLLTKGASTNVTLGLIIPRTSPSHGTAKHLQDSQHACAESTKAAIITAMELANL